MEMFHRLGKLAQEVAKVTAGLVVNTAQIRDFDERLKKQEQAVDERLKKQEQASKHVRSDIRAIREALEGRKVAEDYKDFVDDVEDSKRFILKAKQRERNIKRIVWLMIGGAATALGTFGAGAAWQSCTHTAGVADVHLRHEAEK